MISLDILAEIPHPRQQSSRSYIDVILFVDSLVLNEASIRKSHKNQFAHNLTVWNSVGCRALRSMGGRTDDLTD